MDITLEDETPRTLIRKVSHKLPVSSTPLADFVWPKQPPASKKRLNRKSSLGIMSVDDTPRTMIMKVAKEKAARRSSAFNLVEKNVVRKKVSGKFRRKSEKISAEMEDSSAEDETFVDRSLSSPGLQKNLGKKSGPKPKAWQLTLEQFASGVERLKKQRDDKKEAKKYELSSDAIAEESEENATGRTIIVPVDDLLASSPSSSHSSFRSNPRVYSTSSTIAASPLPSSEPINVDDLIGLPELSGIYADRTPSRMVRKTVSSSESTETIPVDYQEHSLKQQPLKTTEKRKSPDGEKNMENVSSNVSTRRKSLPSTSIEKDSILSIIHQTRRASPLISVRDGDSSLVSPQIGSSASGEPVKSQHILESSAQEQKSVTTRRRSSRLSVQNEKSTTVIQSDPKNRHSLTHDVDQFPTVESSSLSKRQSSKPRQEPKSFSASENGKSLPNKSRLGQKSPADKNQLELDTMYTKGSYASEERVSLSSKTSNKSIIPDQQEDEGEFSFHPQEKNLSYRLHRRSRKSMISSPVVNEDASFKSRPNIQSKINKKTSTIENSSLERNQEPNSSALLSSEISAVTDFALPKNAPLKFQSSPLRETEETFRTIHKNTNLMQVSSIRAIDETSKSEKLPGVSESQEVTATKSRKRKSVAIDSEAEDLILASRTDSVQKQTTRTAALASEIIGTEDELHVADIEGITEEPPVDIVEDDMIGTKAGPSVSPNSSLESWHDLESLSSENPESDEEPMDVELEKSIPVLSSPIQSYATPKDVQEPPRPITGIEQPVARRRIRKLKPSKPQMPLNMTRKLFRHFSNMPLATNAMEILDDCCDVFWENAIGSLEAYANHAGRRTIDVADVELLLYRQGFAKDRNSLNALVEKHLPLELRSLVIPMATAGNIVIP